jgi:hypothetical protein
MDPCVFPNKQNPITKQGCKETFGNMNTNQTNQPYQTVKIPDDPIVQIYFASLGVLGIYILYNLMMKMQK